MENEIKPKKKKNIVKFFFKMLIIFAVVELLEQFGVSFFRNMIELIKYGDDVIKEAIGAVIILIVLILFKNGYVFTQKHEKLSVGLKMAWPYLLVASIMTVINLYNIFFVNKFSSPIRMLSILNLLIFSILIGIFEELLCRGWILNEFLERFSDDKKQIMTSIVLSGFIFGAIHFINLLIGQNLMDTTMQVLSATFFGVTAGLIYYKTKNIWSVIIIHAFWDFSIFLGETSLLAGCTTGDITSSILTYSSVAMLITTLLDFVTSVLAYRNTDLCNQEKPFSKPLLYAAIVIVIAVDFGIAFFAPADYAEYNICPTFENKLLSEEEEISRYTYKSHELTYSKESESTNSDANGVAVFGNTKENYKFKLYPDFESKKTYFENVNIGKKIEIVDGMITNGLIIDNKDTYIVLLQLDDNNIKYAKFNKNEISNVDTYLETVKNSLKDYYVPAIEYIGTISPKDNDHKYAMIYTTIHDILYFGDDDIIYIDEQ